MKAPTENVKHQRRNSELKKVINSVVFSSKNAPLFFDIYFTRVELTKDTKDAKVFFAYLDDESINKKAETIANFETIRKEIQVEIPKAMRLKFVPKLLFRLDEEYYKSKRIESIFEEIKNENPEDDSI